MFHRNRRRILNSVAPTPTKAIITITVTTISIVRRMLPDAAPVAALSPEGLVVRVGAGASPLRRAPYITLGFTPALRLMVIASGVVEP